MSRFLRLSAVLGAAALALTLITAATLGSAPARATSSRHEASRLPAYVAGMVAADAVADQVRSADKTRAGFAGVVVDPWHRGLDVYWHGRPPRAVTRLENDARSHNISMRFSSAPYSQAQLDGFRNKILSSPGEASAGITMTVIYPQASGLTIGVVHGSARARRLPVIANSQIPVRFVHAPVVPLDLAVKQPTRISDTSPIDDIAPLAKLPGRWADDPPFEGGDAISSSYASSSYFCSAGFGVHFKNSPKKFFMLTAGHCLDHGQLYNQEFVIPNNRKAVGRSFAFQPRNDAATIDTSAGVKGAGGGHAIYGGSTSRSTSAGERIEYVRSATDNHVGDLVNTSGAFSGERTGVKVVSTDVEWGMSTVDGVSYRVFGAEMQKTSHTNAAGQGDSGGPVFSFVKGGVSARGIVSAAASPSHRAACTGILEVSGRPRKCFWDVFYGEIIPILPDGNLAINGP